MVRECAGRSRPRPSQCLSQWPGQLAARNKSSRLVMCPRRAIFPRPRSRRGDNRSIRTLPTLTGRNCASGCAGCRHEHGLPHNHRRQIRSGSGHPQGRLNRTRKCACRKAASFHTVRILSPAWHQADGRQERLNAGSLHDLLRQRMRGRDCCRPDFHSSTGLRPNAFR